MDASRRLWPRADLRVGDADRQAVVAELQRHFIDGRLTSEELGERVTQALNAKTFGELSQPLADLPTLSQYEDTPVTETRPDWHRFLFSSPIGAILILVGIMLLMTLLVFPMGRGFGFFPFWPVLIWGFFLIGRPYRGGRRRF
jgi:hypothetical protein